MVPITILLKLGGRNVTNTGDDLLLTTFGHFTLLFYQCIETTFNTVLAVVEKFVALVEKTAFLT